VKAAVSAFPGNGVDTAVSSRSVAQSGAAAGAEDATPREQAAATLPSIPNGRPDRVELRKSLTSRPVLPPATSKEAMRGVEVPKLVRAATAVGNTARNSPPRDDVARFGEAAAPAPGNGLLVAVSKGDIEATRTILQSTDPDAERDADGRTALAIAVLRGYLPLVRLLLASGANPVAVDRFGSTPVVSARASAEAALLQAFGKP
jgi:hypothetical protein